MDLHSDCGRCAALCCIAYPADDMPGFSASKDAGQPCPKLDSCGRCTIYDRRKEEGFSGCIRYECFGAGQHVVQQLFGGRDWRDDPALLKPMVEAFLAMRPVSDLLFLVEYARRQSGSPLDELNEIESQLLEIASDQASLIHRKSIEPLAQSIRRIFATLDPPSPNVDEL